MPSRIHQRTSSLVRRSLRIFNRGAKQSGKLLTKATRTLAPITDTRAEEEKEGVDGDLCANDEQSPSDSIEDHPEASTSKLRGKFVEKTKELDWMGLDILRQKLISYKSLRDILVAIKDAIIAHEKSFAAGARHYDISVRSILLTEGDKGALMDFASASGNDSKHLHSREFMSARQQLSDDTHEPPNRADDLESFFLVLVQVAMSCLPHKAPSRLVEEYHKYVFLNDDGMYKKNFVRDCTLIKLGFEKGPFFDLLQCLSYMFAARYAYPPSEGDSQTKIEQWKQNETLKQRLESDSSQWIINLFTKYINDPRWTPTVPAQSARVEKVRPTDAPTTQKWGAAAKHPKRDADDIVVVDEEEKPLLKPVPTFRIIRPSPEYIEGIKQSGTSKPGKRKRENEPIVVEEPLTKPSGMSRAAKRKRENEPAVAKKSHPRTATRSKPTRNANP